MSPFFRVCCGWLVGWFGGWWVWELAGRCVGRMAGCWLAGWMAGLRSWMGWRAGCAVQRGSGGSGAPLQGEACGQILRKGLLA
eukprot:194618-Rhodomonas_salina.2